MTEQERRDTLIELLAHHPNGATSAMLDALLCWKRSAVSKYLGLLWQEGRIDRERDPASSCGAYIYRVKPPRIASPPSQWQPPARVAERMIREDAEMAK